MLFLQKISSPNANKMVVRGVSCVIVKSTNHLIFACLFAPLTWRIVHFTFNIPPLFNVTNTFENWFEVDKIAKPWSRAGICFFSLGLIELHK